MNFALLMLSLLVLTGGVWLLDRFWLAQKRDAESKERGSVSVYPS